MVEAPLDPPRGKVIVLYLAPSIPQGGSLLCYIDCVLSSIQLIQPIQLTQPIQLI